MKKTENIIRAGDIVRVVNPELVIRIGYDFSFEDAVKEIKATYGEEINGLLRKVKVHHKRWEIVEDAVVRPLAYELVRSKFRHGNERRLHTQIREELRGAEVTVFGKKIAKTGTYFPPTGGDPPYYDDYEPGGLRDCKTHVILEIGFVGKLSRREELLIDQHNVVKANV